MPDQPVILFDGVCNLCNGAINLTIKCDTKNRIKFAALQSEAGQRLAKQYGLPENDLRSFLLVENGKVYNRSTAALRVCRLLPGLWPLCYGLIIVPAFIRNWIYDLVAKYRYQWFGRREQCMVPTPELRARFL